MGFIEGLITIIIFLLYMTVLKNLETPKTIQEDIKTFTNREEHKKKLLESVKEQNIKMNSTILKLGPGGGPFDERLYYSAKKEVLKNPENYSSEIVSIAEECVNVSSLNEKNSKEKLKSVKVKNKEENFINPFK